MLLNTYFKNHKPRGFHYQPRYYDERKEAAKNREERIKRELGLIDKDVPFTTDIKGKFQSARKQGPRKRSMSTFIILLLLVTIVYLLLRNPEIAKFFKF